MGTDAAERLASQIEITGPIRAPQSADKCREGGHAPLTQVYFGWPPRGEQRRHLVFQRRAERQVPAPVHRVL